MYALTHVLTRINTFLNFSNIYKGSFCLTRNKHFMHTLQEEFRIWQWSWNWNWTASNMWNFNFFAWYVPHFYSRIIWIRSTSTQVYTNSFSYLNAFEKEFGFVRRKTKCKYHIFNFLLLFILLVSNIYAYTKIWNKLIF